MALPYQQEQLEARWRHHAGLDNPTEQGHAAMKEIVAAGIIGLGGSAATLLVLFSLLKSFT
jgi:hypothetical protein